MKFAFTQTDIKKIARVLEVQPKKIGDGVRFELLNTPRRRRLSMEIYSDIDIGVRKGISFRSTQRLRIFSLHYCTGYVVSALLGEVTFVGESAGKLSGLTIERGGGCSLYANVDRSILSGDFTRLGPEVMLSGIALSLTESVLPPLSKAAEKDHLECSETEKTIRMIIVSHNHPFLRFPKELVPHVLQCVYKGEGRKTLPTMSIVFTHTQEMRAMNRKYLQHQYDTDIITFDLGEEKGEEAELYINLDAARRQAAEYGVTFRHETQRLLIHGALHLLGYHDATACRTNRHP